MGDEEMAESIRYIAVDISQYSREAVVKAAVTGKVALSKVGTTKTTKVGKKKN